MATLTVYTAAITGATPVPVTPGASDEFTNSGREMALIYNGSGSPITATLDVQRTTDADGATVTDPAVTIAAGAYGLIGPFPSGYTSSSTGRAKITCSATTSVTIVILKLP